MNKLSPFLNLIKAYSSYHLRKTKLNYPPFYLILEPTNNCNLHCPICPNKLQQKSSLGFMEFSVYKKIIDECKSFAIEVSLYFRGEPLLHPNIFKMIEYAKNNNILTCLHTNATLLKKGNIFKIFSSGLDYMSISFDGFIKEVYETNRVGADFEKVLENIKEFLKQKKKNKFKKPYTVIQTIITGIENSENLEKSLENFYENFKNLPLNEMTLKVPTTWGNTFKDKSRAVFKKLSDKFHHCAYLWGMQTVLWNGNIMPCCVDFFEEYPVGNIKTDNLLESWNSDRMIELRKKMIEKNPYDLMKCCRNCDSLWGTSFLGMPPGFRRALEMPFINIFGFGFEKIVKKIGKNKIAFKLMK